MPSTSSQRMFPSLVSASTSGPQTRSSNSLTALSTSNFGLVEVSSGLPNIGGEPLKSKVKGHKILFGSGPVAKNGNQFAK